MSNDDGRKTGVPPGWEPLYELELLRQMPHNFEREQWQGDRRLDFSINDDSGYRQVVVEVKSRGPQGFDAEDQAQIRAQIDFAIDGAAQRANYLITEVEHFGHWRLLELVEYAEQKGIHLELRDIRDMESNVRELAARAEPVREVDDRANRDTQDPAEQDARDDTSERAEREAQDNAEQEPREAGEREASERTESEGLSHAGHDPSETTEREASEGAERETQDHTEQDAGNKIEAEAQNGGACADLAVDLNAEQLFDGTSSAADTDTFADADIDALDSNAETGFFDGFDGGFAHGGEHGG